MLFTDNLEEIIFNRHQIHETDELIVLSGYLGPNPVKRLEQLPFNSTVIYGMYGSYGIKHTLHNLLVDIHKNVRNLNIYYSNLPIHSKCYTWKKNGNIVHALVGSANFSTNGLSTPFREILAETTFDTFKPLDNYIQYILKNSILCTDIEKQLYAENSSYCSLSLLARNGEVQDCAGLNWGQNENNHTRINDAYIAIRVNHIKSFPNLFQPKQLNILKKDKRGRVQRNNEAIEIIWDDGTTMEGLLEGSQPINGIIYPKQISSFPRKSELGEYFHNRLNVPLGEPIKKHHLEKYGRTDVMVSLLEEGVYKFDFSVSQN